MGNAVYLGLSVLASGSLTGGYMGFLILAHSDDDASHKADLFVHYVERLGDDTRTPEQVAACQRGLIALRPHVALVQEDGEIRALSRTLATHFPGVAAQLLKDSGCVILLRVSEEDGFPTEVHRMLRMRMTKHHVAAALDMGLTR